MPETILGKVSVTPKGAYDAGTQYERLDAVSHGGGSWMALKTVQGVEPGTAPESWMQLAAPGKNGTDGIDGNPGAAATIQVGEVVTLEPGQPAAVENTGTEQAAVLKISIPRGQNGRDGDPGQAGAAATIQVGQVTTLDAGQQATVSNVGTASAARFDFGIPKGQDGEDGDPGEDGGYYTPSVDGSGNLNWTASKAGMPPVEGANIRGPQGPAGPTRPAPDEPVPELISTTNTSPQTPGASTDLNLGTKSTDLGTAIDYTDSSTDVSLTENGVYMVSFHSDTKSNSGAVTAQATLQLDSTPVEGGTAQHYFADTTGEANISFTVPVTVSSAPETLTVVSDNADATFTNATLTVWKIGVTA